MLSRQKEGNETHVDVHQLKSLLELHVKKAVDLIESLGQSDASQALAYIIRNVQTVVW